MWIDFKLIFRMIDVHLVKEFLLLQVLNLSNGACHILEYFDGLSDMKHYWQELGTKLAK